MKDVTKPLPIVGGVAEGIGNAPLAKKIGGQEEEEKGYLGKAFEYAGGAVRTVYDAAGNAVSLPHTAFIPARHLPDELFIDWYRRSYGRRILAWICKGR